MIVEGLLIWTQLMLSQLFEWWYRPCFRWIGWICPHPFIWPKDVLMLLTGACVPECPRIMYATIMPNGVINNHQVVRHSNKLQLSESWEYELQRWWVQMYLTIYRVCSILVTPCITMQPWRLIEWKFWPISQKKTTTPCRTHGFTDPCLVPVTRSGLLILLTTDLKIMLTTY